MFQVYVCSILAWRPLTSKRFLHFWFVFAMRSFVAVLLLCSIETQHGRRLLAAEQVVFNVSAGQMSEKASKRTQMAARAMLSMSLNRAAAFSSPAAAGRIGALRAMHSVPSPGPLAVWESHVKDGTDKTTQDFFSKLGLSHEQRNTLLSRQGVGTRISSPEFRAGLDRLRTEWSMDAPQLVAFMSDSVAARIGSPDFWVGLDRLRTEYGMDAPRLVKFMSNNVAARIDLPDF